MGADEKSLLCQSSTSSDAQKYLPVPNYLNWSAPMQAYYSSGTTLPPFFKSTAASTVGQSYICVAQHPMLSECGAPPPSSAVYSCEAQLAPVTNCISMERKSSDDKDLIFMDTNNRTPGNEVFRDQRSVERLKEASGSENVGASNINESACASSSQASDENANEEESSTGKKRRFNQSLDNEANATSNNYTQQICENPSTIVPGKAATHTTQLERSNASGSLQPFATEACGGMLHDHRQYTDQLEVKRKKRKQSNREAARRSRLRKMAECEELQEKVDILHEETRKLRNEQRKITEECEKVTSENDIITEELKQCGGPNVSLDILIGNTGAVPSSVSRGELNGHSMECK